MTTAPLTEDELASIKSFVKESDAIGVDVSLGDEDIRQLLATVEALQADRTALMEVRTAVVKWMFADGTTREIMQAFDTLPSHLKTEASKE